MAPSSPRTHSFGVPHQATRHPLAARTCFRAGPRLVVPIETACGFRSGTPGALLVRTGYRHRQCGHRHRPPAQDGEQLHHFGCGTKRPSSSNQLSTTITSGSLTTCLSIKKLSPSGATSKCGAEPGNGYGLPSNISSGFPYSNAGLSLMATTINPLLLQ